MTPDDARTLALQIAMNAVESQAHRQHGRTRFTFADAGAIEIIQAVLLGLKAPAASDADQEMADLDHEQGEKLDEQQERVAEVLELRKRVS